MKTKLLAFSFSLFFSTSLLFSQDQIGAKVVFSEAKANFGQVAAINNSGNFLISGASYQYSTDQKGFARVYNLQNGIWKKLGNDLEGNANGDTFGIAVAMNEVGNTVAVGATQVNDGNYTGPGYVKVFRFSSGQYVQLGNDIVGEATGDTFGGQIAMNGDGTKIVVGAIFNDANTGNQFASVGHVRVYSFDGANWNLLGAEIDGDNANDNFGNSVDINKNGDRIVVSASGVDAGGVNKGLVRVYEFSGGNWIKVGQDIIGNADNDRLTNVSINDTGDRISFRTKGIVKVYELNGTQWQQLGGNIIGMNNDIGTSNLDNTGTVVGVASRSADSNKGYIQLYNYKNNVWTQAGNTITGDVTGDNLGSSIEVKNKYVVAGSSDYNLSTENNSGVRAYNFNTVLSVKDDVSLLKIGLFPNPTSGVLKISGIEVQKIEVYSLQGKLLQTSRNSNTISLQNRALGMYFLRIVDVNNNTIHKKIMVQ